MCRDLLGIDDERVPQRAFGGLRITDRPLVVRERESRVDGLGRQLHGFPERLPCLGTLAAAELSAAERRPCRRIRGVEPDRLLDLLERPRGMIQPGERISEQDVRRCAVRLRLQRKLRTRPSMLVLARCEQERPGLDLRVDVRRLQVSRPGEGRIRLDRISDGGVRARQLLVSLR
jgi:hypothetical protein